MPGNNFFTKPKMPTDEQVSIACLWLEHNEGIHNGEKEACLTVAKWIEYIQDQIFLKRVAKANGLSVTDIRKQLKKNVNKNR